MPSYYGGTAQRTDPKFLIERLMRNGYSRMQAAAIVGNLQRESGFASNVMNKEEGAYGLMQWRGPRFNELQKFAAEKGVPWTDPGTQADFIAHEMQTTERKNAGPFMQARTIDEASAALKPVIRYGDKSMLDRQMFAREAFGAPIPTPGAAAASPAPQPTAAQPAVSRETAQAYADQPVRRGLRGGLEAIGDAIGTGIREHQAGRLQPKLARLGDALSGAAQQMAPAAQTSVPAGAAPVSRAGLAAQITAGQAPRPATSYTEPATGNQMVTGAPGRYEQGDVLNLGSGVAPAPPGAPEPPRFPGGAPMPRPRPVLNPDLMRGDPALPGQLIPRETVAELGSLVDPMRYDYG